MTESVFDQIVISAKELDIDLSAEEIAALVQKENMSEQSVSDISTVFRYLEQKHIDSVIDGCLKFSRLPRKEPKTFENFDFSRIHGKDIEALKNISTLAPLYARKNLAFIGPQGIGKTHLVNIPVWRSHSFRPMVPPRFRWREPPNPEMGTNRRRTDQITVNEMVSSVNDYLSFFNFE